MAALQAVALCASQDLFLAQEIVSRIIPATCQRCTDSVPEVRTLAFQTIETLLYQARLHLDPQRPAPTKEEDEQHQQESVTTEPLKGIARELAASPPGWTGWAVKKAIEFYGSKESGFSKVDSIEAQVNLKREDSQVKRVKKHHANDKYIEMYNLYFEDCCWALKVQPLL